MELTRKTTEVRAHTRPMRPDKCFARIVTISSISRTSSNHELKWLLSLPGEQGFAERSQGAALDLLVLLRRRVALRFHKLLKICVFSRHPFYSMADSNTLGKYRADGSSHPLLSGVRGSHRVIERLQFSPPLEAR